MKPRFNPTISLGNILTLIGMFVSVFMAWHTLDKDVAIIKTTQSSMKEEQEKLSERMVSVENYIYKKLAAKESLQYYPPIN
jgi:hypothetical protein